MRTYAIGDIHGHLDRLVEAHRRIAEDRRRTGDDDAPVVHLGDLVDRGPDSAGVITRLAEGAARGEPWVVLKGNHDRMFLGFLGDGFYHDPGLRSELRWLDARLGGPATLASYGIDGADSRDAGDLQREAARRVPEAHRDVLAGARHLYRRGELAFAHAGIRPGVALDDQAEDDLLWIRVLFLDDARDHGALIVHGHTALMAPEHHGNRVNLDSGAGYGRELTAAVFEGREAFVLGPGGRVPLRPPG